MIYLLWSLFNIGMLVWFLLIAFGALKLFLKEMGMVSTIIFVIGIFSFIKGSVVSNQDKGYQMKQNEAVGMKNLESAISYHLDLSYIYTKDSTYNGKLSSKILVTGLISGHGWNPGLTYTEMKNGIINYNVTGDHQWKLLGLVLYNQEQEFKGTVKVK
ncbi:hypothetical protein [Dyadobacter frigoris]|uniref:Uncharacterized protein n=1 Tax=Dyadobacter frigoris TaxID=2576211 RepID=A0A4U6D6E5_9BACT|nr:hypothetical protein [Dyadobacter frigoris]TKT91831.1 hypothetical protein FDK13_11785 [Dyadobacter frigoris]GLU53308.1 hypothetical protein Dfri01_27690 [Dyadobacter frigoris]